MAATAAAQDDRGLPVLRANGPVGDAVNGSVNGNGVLPRYPASVSRLPQVPAAAPGATQGMYVGLSGLSELAGQVGGPPLMNQPVIQPMVQPVIQPMVQQVAPSVQQVQHVDANGLLTASRIETVQDVGSAMEQAYLHAPQPATGGFLYSGSELPVAMPASFESTFIQPTFIETVFAEPASAGPADFARFWARGEVLLWFMEGLNNGPLATSNPAGTPGTRVGLPSNPSTSSLFGGNLGNDLRVGGRATFGYWLGCDNCRAIQGEFFGLGSPGNRFDSDLANGGILSRPFTNTDVGGEDAQIFSMPGLTAGNLTMDFSSELWSAAISMRRQLCCNADPCDPCTRKRLDLLYGYRYMHLGETFRSSETLMPSDPRFVPGTTLTLDDEIRTENDFHGFEFGLQSSSVRGRWSTQLTSLVAIGQVRKRVRLDGSTNSFVPGFADDTIDGGFIVGPDMIGTGKSQEFGVIPQARLNMGYFLTRNFQLNVGYDFLYFFDAVRPDSWLNVTRAGSDISRRVPATIARTDLAVPDNGVWLHGASLGFTYTY